MARVIELDGAFDGKRPLSGVAIVVEDGAVAWFGKRARLPAAYARAERLAARGSFAIPGMINCHSHLTLSGSADFAAEARLPVATQALKAHANALLELRSGVTTVRDLGAAGTTVVELARATASGLLVGPRIVAAGRGVTSTGGHGLEIGRMADGADDVRRAVREQLMDGATVIKLFSTGGVLGEGARPEVSQYTAEETRAAVQEAHRGGVKITTHAHSAAGVRVAVAAGIDSIEHGTLLDARTVRLLRERDVSYVPTLSALAMMLPHLDRLPPHVGERARVVAARHHDSVRLAHRAGVRIATGTDFGTPFNTHDLFAEELRLMHEVGMSNEDVLVAATTNAARVIGDDRAGRIAAGSHADLVFVNGDPLADLELLRAPAAVWVRGREIAPPA